MVRAARGGNAAAQHPRPSRRRPAQERHPQKRAQERLLHNAIRDGLTGLPNRELFLDRLQTALARAKDENTSRPCSSSISTLLKNQARSPDFATNDGVLLTIARRLTRHISPQDTLARISALQFAILISEDTEPRNIAMLAERVRRSLRTPMKVGGRDLVITGSIGIAMFDGTQETAEDLFARARARCTGRSAPARTGSSCSSPRCAALPTSVPLFRPI